MAHRRVVRRTLIHLFPLIVSLLSLPGLAIGEERSVERILSELAREPTIEEVQQAALKQAALEPQRVASLLRRVRWAGVLPRVEASLRRGYARDEDLDREFEEMDDLSLATDQDLEFRVSVRWDLDRLIFDPEELRARREALYQTQRRRELLLAVTRMYYELLLLRAQDACGGENEGDELSRTLRMAELRALLDGLTGGLMSRHEGSSSSD
jgi:hypothetical protein